jgi:hypothetical protein
LPSKTQFFSDLAQSVPLSAWRMHKESGHFNPDISEAFRDYRLDIEELYEADRPANPGRQGVLEHVLVVAARVDVMGQLLELSQEMRAKLRTAAILHDAGKYEERLVMLYAQRQGISEWDAYLQAGTRSVIAMNQLGLHKDVISIANAAGHTSIPTAREYLKCEQLTDTQKSWLALHYIDDITRGSASIQPASIHPQTSILENDLDRRMDMNRANPAYANLNKEGMHREGFAMPTFDAQQEVGHAVEQRLFAMITAEKLCSVAALKTLPVPAQLPEIIDQLVQSHFQLPAVS